jgi:hypothetical protein
MHLQFYSETLGKKPVRTLRRRLECSIKIAFKETGLEDWTGLK